MDIVGIGTDIVECLRIGRMIKDHGEMFLVSLHRGVSLQDARDNTAWELRVGEGVGETPPPTEEELRLVREELDPEGAYTR